MTELEKVIKGLEHCGRPTECNGCPYDSEMGGCFTNLKRDALKLLKEHKEHEELLTKLGYHWTGNGETLALCKKSKDGEQE